MNHQFSSCVVRMGAQGNTALTGTDVIGVNQDLTLDIAYGRKDLFDAVQNSVFAVDTADDEGKVTIKITNNDLAAKMLAYTTGATSASGTVNGNAATIWTIGQLSKPQPCRFEFDGITTAGKNIHFIATLCKPKGHSISAKIGDFASVPLEIDVYPDPNAATAGTVFTYSVDN